jgi:hypothetical protein
MFNEMLVACFVHVVFRSWHSASPILSVMERWWSPSRRNHETTRGRYNGDVFEGSRTRKWDLRFRWNVWLAAKCRGGTIYPNIKKIRKSCAKKKNLYSCNFDFESGHKTAEAPSTQTSRRQESHVLKRTFILATSTSSLVTRLVIGCRWRWRGGLSNPCSSVLDALLFTPPLPLVGWQKEDASQVMAETSKQIH